jgi:hypothetical protein
MAKVTITHTGDAPSEQIVKKANERTIVTDARGRSIAVRKLTPLDRMRMSKAAGAENATNQPYMLYALVACSVVAIDGDDQIIPTNDRQLEAAISLLGEDGYDAALEAVIAMYGSQSEETIAAAKK